jgi:arylsulfatase A-like enzyme
MRGPRLPLSDETSMIQPVRARPASAVAALRAATIVAVVVTAVSVPACRREPVVLPRNAPLVLVVVDTLRADSLGLYGSSHPTSEGLDRWAERGAVFERAFAASNWTLPSVASLLTGRYPSGHGSGRAKETLPNGRTRRVFVALDGSVPRLATLLAQAGYDTAAFVTNTFLRPGFGVAEGFATYDQSRNRAIGERRADVMVDRALAWIDQHANGAPCFLLLHLLDPHQPYDPPPGAAGRFTADYRGTLTAPIGPSSGLVRQVKRREIDLDAADRAFVRGVYDEEVAFVAAHLSRLLDGLAERGVLERGVVVLTADHGEEFFDHGALEHGHTLYHELLRVPLVVWGSGVRAGRHREPVSLVDVLPTLLDAVGLAVPEGTDGASLWPLLTGRGGLRAERQLVAENSLYGDQRRAIIEWPWKLVVDVERPDTALFDLERDPAESENLAAARPEIVERLGAALERRVPRRSGEAPVELDAETREELRALGYLR